MFHLLLLLHLTSLTDDELVLMMADARWLYEWMRKLQQIYFSEKTLLFDVHPCTNWARTAIERVARCSLLIYSVSQGKYLSSLWVAKDYSWLENVWVAKMSATTFRRLIIVVRTSYNTSRSVWCFTEQNTSHWWSGSNEKKIYWSESCSHS